MVGSRSRACTRPGFVAVRALVLVVLALVGLAIPPMTSGAQTTRRLTLTPSSGPPGTTVVADGVGYPAGFRLSLHLDAVGSRAPLIEDVVVGSSGTFRVTIVVPTSTGPGTHPLYTCLQRSPSSLPICDSAPAARFIVTGTTPTPPSTDTIPPIDPPIVGPTSSSTSSTTPPQLAPSPTTLGGDPPAPSSTYGVGIATTTTELPVGVPDTDFPDLWITAMEITQGIQDLENSMPLIEDRRTWVRVYPRVDTDLVWGPVDGAMLLTNGGDDQIIYPENGPIGAIRDLPDRTDRDAALNFLVPTSYVRSGTELKALIWSFSPSTLTSSEPIVSNNMKSVLPAFHDASEPTIILLPLDDGAGPGPAPTVASTLAAADAVAADLRKYLPMAQPAINQYIAPIGPGEEASTSGQWTFTTGALRDEPLIRLSLMHALWGLADEQRILGSLDNSIPAGGYAGWSKSSYFSAWTKPSDGTPAHEIGHQGGLGHVGCKDTNPADGIPDELAGGGLDATYPTALPNCSLAPVDPEGFFGLTNYDDPFVVYSNDPAHPAAAYPFMSYMSTTWIDPYHYCRLLSAYGVTCNPAEIGVPGKHLPTDPIDCTPEESGPFGLELCLNADLPSAPSGSPTDPLVLVGAPERVALSYPTGPIADYQYAVFAYDARAGTGSIGSVFPLPATPALDRQFHDLVTQVKTGLRSTRLVARLVDGAGNALVVVPIDRDESSGHGHGEGRDGSGLFVQPIPLVEGAIALELVDGDRVLDSRERTASAPQATIDDVVATGRSVKVRWTANDADGGAVTSTVSWSADGEDFRPVVLDSTATEATIDDLSLPGGEVTIRVRVDDGWSSTHADATPITIPTTPPQVGITGAADGDQFAHFAPIDLVAQAFDPEDGMLDGPAITWSSDVDGDLGTGRGLTVRDLSVGRHVITAAATDGSGAGAGATVTIDVVDDGRPAPRAEGAEPDAERVLRNGIDDAGSGSGGSLAVWLAVGVGLIAIAAAGAAAARGRAVRRGQAA
jgi:hypothetical protein